MIEAHVSLTCRTGCAQLIYHTCVLVNITPLLNSHLFLQKYEYGIVLDILCVFYAYMLCDTHNKVGNEKLPNGNEGFIYF